MDRNLQINLKNPEAMVNGDIISSNEVYNNGYIPYFMRRRVDLHEGEKYELVNDVSVEFEFARLHQYANRKVVDKQHISELINYMISKNTLFVPWVILEGDEVITEGDSYRHANMAWEILKHYIHEIICHKVKYYNEGADTPEKVMKNITWFINRNDLSYFILTAFKLGYDATVAKIFATIIWGFEYHNNIEDNSDLKKYFSEAILNRMVVYSLVGSNKGDFEDHLKLALHKRFPELICRIAATFNFLEAGMVDIGKIKTEYLIKFAFEIMNNGYDISVNEFGNHPRFPVRKYIIDFYSKAVENMRVKDEYKFQALLANQECFSEITPEFKEIESLIPREGFGPDEVYFKNRTIYNSFVNLGTWLFGNLSHICIVQPEWINLKNRNFAEMFSYVLLKKTKIEISLYKSNIAFNLNPVTNIVTQTIDSYIEIIKERIKEAKAVKPEETTESIISRIPEMQFFSYLIQNIPKGYNIHEIVWKLWNTEELKNYVLNLIPIYNKQCYKENGHESWNLDFLDNTIDDMVNEGYKLENIMKNVNVYRNINWIKKNYGKLFVELPDYIFANTNEEPDDFSKEDLEWVMSVLTSEQQKAYPFTIGLMRKYPEIFKPLVDRVNIDRYIKAYGLNWVEKNTEISISDIVNANAYVNEQVIRRYLDIILLDNELRKKFLSNKEVIKILAGYVEDEYSFYNKDFHDNKTLIKDILRSDNFTNEVKCEVLMRLECNKIPTKLFVTNYEQYLPGSGNTGRALVAMVGVINYITDYEKLISSDIFDIEPEEKKETKITNVEENIKKIYSERS